MFTPDDVPCASIRNITNVRNKHRQRKREHNLVSTVADEDDQLTPQNHISTPVVVNEDRKFNLDTKTVRVRKLTFSPMSNEQLTDHTNNDFGPLLWTPPRHKGGFYIVNYVWDALVSDEKTNKAEENKRRLVIDHRVFLIKLAIGLCNRPVSERKTKCNCTFHKSELKNIVEEVNAVYFSGKAAGTNSVLDDIPYQLMLTFQIDNEKSKDGNYWVSVVGHDPKQEDMYMCKIMNKVIGGVSLLPWCVWKRYILTGLCQGCEEDRCSQRHHACCNIKAVLVMN